MVKRISAFLLSLTLLLVLALPVGAAGYGIDTGASTSMTFHFVYDDGTAVEGAPVTLYKVATLDDTGSFTLCADFAQYADALDELSLSTAETWQDVADLLEGWVLRDGQTPLAATVTDAQGDAVFSGLDVGLYLALGQRYLFGEHFYYTRPVLTSLPRWNGEDWDYDAAAFPKLERAPRLDEVIDVSVTVIWDDEGCEDERPGTVTIDLICDGEVVDTITIGPDEDWRFLWENLDPNHDWQVVQHDPNGYDVTKDREGYHFTFINYRRPAQPDTPGPSGTLPQTGVLWWPVAVLLLAGMLLYLLGWVRGRER